MEWGVQNLYLRSVPRLVNRFWVSQNSGVIEVHVDSDWAGNRIDRKSTTGVVVRYGGQVVKTYSRNQKTVALSSGEAELYAIVSGTSEALGIQSIIRDFGRDGYVVVNTDSIAAIGITKRSGNGRIRHLQTQFLWIQELVVGGRISIYKVPGNVNPADLMTKYLGGESIAQCIRFMNLVKSLNRPDNAPLLQSVYYHWFY